MKVKMINKVPLPDGQGGAYSPAPGDEVEVTQGVGEALLRGGDAEECKAPAQPVKAQEASAEEASAPGKKKAARKSKNRGAAPENK
jgi:hypothetical protein